MSYYAIDTTNDLAHHGILGMKWGVRRYQNEDGSLTSAGRLRYYGAGGDRKGYYKEKGLAKRYKDTMKSASRHQKYAGFTKDYKAWVKEDPKNRTGQRAQYELLRAQKMLGGKKGMADAKYAYEHKNLAKYVNRDGSLTLAGKLKYWDTDKERGQRRMERDINRDKNSMTTSGKAYAKNRLSTMGKITGKLYSPAGVALAVGSTQKDPTKYLRRNAAKTTKYATRSVINTLTGRPISGAINATKAIGSSTLGAGAATARTALRLGGNAARATASGAIVGKSYNPKSVTKKAINSTRKAGFGMARDVNSIENLNRSASRQAKALNAANKASEGVAKAAKYSYDTNMQTMRYIKDTVTGKKKKRN